MNFKRFNGSTWETVRHKIYGSGTDSLTAFPAQIQASGEALTDYLISGNTVQNGTPTPEAPVDVVGCGVRTGNLFDKDATDTNNGYVANKYLTSSGDTVSSTLYNISEYIGLSPSTVYTVFSGRAIKNPSICFYDANKNYIEGIAYDLMDTITVTTPANAKYCRVSYVKALSGVFMINRGSTALPYEPYGYKIPITVNGTEHPIYLGQVQTTRRIKKLVLTGEENNWTYSAEYTRFTIIIPNAYNTGVRRDETPCTHYISIHDGRAIENVPDNSVYTAPSAGNVYLSIKDTAYTSLDAWKTWLAQQYANGTPVTVWYVLETPETAVVNEPLMKIGDYADTVSYAQAGVAIPTSDGDNTISFGTTVQPSAMSATFKGWHPVQGAKVYDGNDWS